MDEKKTEHSIRSSFDSKKRIGEAQINRGSKEFFEWCEELIRKKVYWSVHYDLNTPQSIDFDTFTYQESIFDSCRLKTLSAEMNIRLLEETSQYTEEFSNIRFDWFDKYKSMETNNQKWLNGENLIIMPGGNLNHLINWDYLDKLILIDEIDFMFKPHPVSEAHYITKCKEKFGAERMIPVKVSLKDAAFGFKRWITTSSSETSVLGYLFGKEMDDFTKPSKRFLGNYCDLNYFIKKLDQNTRKDIFQKKLLAKDSGFFFPFMKDIEERIEIYVEKAIKKRENLQPRIKIRNPL